MTRLPLVVNPADYNDQDAANTIRELPEWWRQVTGSVPDLDGPLAATFAPLAAVLGVERTATTESWATAIYKAMIAAPLAAQPRTLTSEALVAALGLVHEAGAALVTVPGSGRVHQISTSGGGVPKRAVANAEIGWRGVVGDRQDSRQFHGRPWQALCLWSLEVIEAFAADGHPIFPGAAGENITIAGIDWATVHPGTQVQIGEVVAEISMWAEPCRQNAAWFRDGEFRLMHADRGPVSRAYATVLRPGSVFRDAVVGVLD